MRKIALKYYACPACRSFPLSLSDKREEVVFVNDNQELSSRRVRALFPSIPESEIEDLYRVHVKEGALICMGCTRVYEISHFIPHLREDQALSPTEYHPQKYSGDTVRKTETLLVGKAREEKIYELVKKLLPFERAKKVRAKQNLEHDLEYRTKHSEKDKYVHLFENYISKKPHVVLELGIGQGGFTSSVKRLLKPDVFFGLDYERGWLDVAKMRDFETECVVADARKMPFRDNAFDFMYSAYTLEHIPGVEAVVKETGRLTQEAFYIFGPSSWAPFDFHFEKAPLLPMLPRSLAKRWAYFWKVTRTGFDYSRAEISDEYDAMNYMRPAYFERICKKHNIIPEPLLWRFMHYSFANAYQYHSIMKLAASFEVIIIPIIKLIEALKVQPIMVYFLHKNNKK